MGGDRLVLTAADDRTITVSLEGIGLSGVEVLEHLGVWTTLVPVADPA